MWCIGHQFQTVFAMRDIVTRRVFIGRNAAWSRGLDKVSLDRQDENCESAVQSFNQREPLNKLPKSWCIDDQFQTVFGMRDIVTRCLFIGRNATSWRARSPRTNCRDEVDDTAQPKFMESAAGVHPGTLIPFFNFCRYICGNEICRENLQKLEERLKANL